MGIYHDVIVKIGIPKDFSVRNEIQDIIKAEMGNIMIVPPYDYGAALINHRTTGQEDPTQDYLDMMERLVEAGAKSGYLMIITEEIPTVKLDLRDGNLRVQMFNHVELTEEIPVGIMERFKKQGKRRR